MPGLQDRGQPGLAARVRAPDNFHLSHHGVGLRERLAVVSAESRLTAAPVPCGFRLTATVPHRPSTKTGTPQ